jgi:hypothetical protein
VSLAFGWLVSGVTREVSLTGPLILVGGLFTLMLVGELELSELEQLPVRAGLPLLELERGWLQRWVVLDRKTGKPVVGAIATHAVDPFSGASLHDGSTWLPSPPSDARGVVELMLSSPPARISIQAQGYEPRVLDVAPGAGVYGSGLSIADATVLLDSVAAVRSGVR